MNSVVKTVIAAAVIATAGVAIAQQSSTPGTTAPKRSDTASSPAVKPNS
jgi:hypothetical protein